MIIDYLYGFSVLAMMCVDIMINDYNAMLTVNTLIHQCDCSQSVEELRLCEAYRSHSVSVGTLL